MSNEKDIDKDLGAMDDLKIRKNIPNFSNKPTTEKTKEPSAPAEKNSEISMNDNNIIDGSSIVKSPSHMKLVKGNGVRLEAENQPFYNSENIQAQVSSSTKKSSSFEAGASFGNEGASASVGMKTSKTTEVSSSASAEIDKKHLHESLQAKGIDLKDGKVPLDELSKVILASMGIEPEELLKLDAKERDKVLAKVSERIEIALREEKGMEFRAGVNTQKQNPNRNGQDAGAQGPGGSTIASEVIAATGALVGGAASLALGSVRVIGAAGLAAGKGLSGLVTGRDNGSVVKANEGTPAQRFDGVAVLPTISEYRVNQVEKSADGYQRAVENFWQVPPMAAMRKEIEERARTTGLSVPDAMAKMKPGGEWADLHEKFVKEVAGSPDAVKAKVGMDQALKSWVRQYDRGSEELLSADVEENPHHRKAKNRVDATMGKMEELAGETPVFGGETQSHAERLKASVQAILERLREILQTVKEKVFGGAEHATP